MLDENIAYAREAFSEFGEVMLMQGRFINNDVLKDADALIVRSVTKVNETLLKDTNVFFVGSATIGTDHIDKEYLNKRGIHFAGAKGCNADAVAEYVLTAIFNYIERFDRKLDDLSIGIIGVGTIGKRIEQYAEAFGITVIPNDPPLQEKTGDPKYRSLEEALQADIVTIHTPLTFEGNHKTYHLINESNCHFIKEGSLVINSARGRVIDTEPFLHCIMNKNICTVLDVWENEPEISITALKRADFATPHVAGYTLQGKVNGTKMVYDRFAILMGQEQKWEPSLPPLKESGISIKTNHSVEDVFAQVMLQVYDIYEDTLRFKQLIHMSESDRTNYFDRLRRNYPLRREFTDYRIFLEPYNERMDELFTLLRFG